MTWPTKDDFVDGDVLTAAQVNNIADNLNVFDPTSATSGQVWVANGSGSGAYGSAGAYTVITSGNLNTTTGVDITSIPATYRHLHLYFIDAQIATSPQLRLRINNVSSSDYNNAIWLNSSVALSTARPEVEVSPGPTANDPFGVRVNFYNYATSQFQSGDCWLWNNSSVSSTNRVINWRLRSSQIVLNRITMQVASGTFNAGSFVLLGAS